MDFVSGATIRIRAKIYDDDDALVDPTTSVKLDIIDPIGTKAADNQDMASSVTGIWDYYYNTTAGSKLGLWRYEIRGADSTKTSIATGTFNLRKS